MHRLRRLLLSLACGFTFTGSLLAQTQSGDRPPAPRDAASTHRLPEPSDLVKENFDHVAASALLIRGVLVKDPGILVELKRWVAKEAADNGQVVEDSALTDDAIFERLDRDVAFRSVATRLAQRYGYLLPSVNPDSEIGKQQDFVLKERARRLVQIEAQEDSESMRPRRNEESQEANSERTACDPRRQANCSEPTALPARPESVRPDEIPGAEPNQPSVPERAPSSIDPRLMQANIGRDESGLQGYPNTESGLTMASDPSKGAQDGLTPGAPTGSTRGSGNSLGSGNASNLSSLPVDGRNEVATATRTGINSSARPSPNRGAYSIEMEREVPSVAMIRKRNPYSDIPSLYDMYVQASSREREPERFGLEVFRNGTRDSNAIPMDLPVGPDYVLGPGDGLAIDLWGGISQRMLRTVDREGRVSLPEAGPVLVSGHTLAEVQQSVQQILRTQFRDVSADISLSRLRTVRVYVVGDVAEPGAYDISSLSTPLNALFVAGGVTSRGSLRALRHFRGKQLVEEVDAYDLLLHGVRGNLGRLENGDTLLVPPMGPQVTIDGMVRRPAVYELHEEKTLEDALELAGGILPAAALQHIEVQRLEAHEKRTMLSLDIAANSDPDAVAKELNGFKIQDGDQIHIFPIASYNEKVIYLQGHVLRPGRYSYRDGMKLTDIIASYKDVLPEPAGHYAEIVRLNPPDFRPSVKSFDLAAALDNPATAPQLQPLDTVRVFSRYDFEPAPTAWVGGEVRQPGQYRTSGQAHFRDAIYLAGGVSPDASLDSAQLFRTQPDGNMRILSVNLGEALAGNPLDNVLLQPRDRILVHRNFAKVDPATVDVTGEVAKPGRYPLTTNMHVEDLIRVAGGLKRSADTNTADLTRYTASGGAAEQLQISLASLRNGNASEDVPLRSGDVLAIRQVPGWSDIGAAVKVSGEVKHPSTFGIQPGERLSSVLERAGGYTDQAYPYGAVLMRREVKEMETQAQMELIARMNAERAQLVALPEGDANQKNVKLNALAQTDSAMVQLAKTPPIGRVVIHIASDVKQWKNTPADVALRDGDVLVIPKKANVVMVNGQVFNPTAISAEHGRSAKWYLSQAGGLTPIADKKAVFVIRADGSVISSKNNGAGWFSGDPMSAALRPGDMVVVPEKTPKIGGMNWTAIMQTAQVASSVALAVAYIHP
jgi:protein involved in polysaccharide export with SLBB domain